MSSGVSELKQHIGRIKQLRKTVNAMYLLSAVQLQKELPKADYSQQYITQLREVIKKTLQSAGELKNTPYFAQKENGNALFLSLMSEKGLCGGYNRAVAALTKRVLCEKREISGNEPLLYCIGERGAKGFARTGIIPKRIFAAGEAQKSTEFAMSLARELTDAYLSEAVNEVYVIYTPFGRNAPEPLCRRLLPLLPEDFLTDRSADTDHEITVEPDIKSFSERLVPLYCAYILYEYILQASVQENMVRRQALQSAIDNADELIEELELSLNEERRLNITNEIAQNSAARTEN